MKTFKPSVVLLFNSDNLTHLKNCASICYHSTPFDAIKLRCNLIEHGHLSMLRHESYYYRVPVKQIGGYYLQYFRNDAYCHCVVYNKNLYLVINGQWKHEHQEMIDKIGLQQHRVDPAVFYVSPETQELMRLTFVINTQIAVSREANRVSPNNIAERSTRYIDLIKKLGIRFSTPHWYEHLNLWRKLMFGAMTSISGFMYKLARSKYGLNLIPEDARYFLPVGIETEVAYTYTVKEWRHIIDLRYHDKTGKAHPDIKQVIKPIHDYICQHFYKAE